MTFKRRIGSLLSAAFTAIVLFGGASGCASSSEPSITGFAMGSTRFVTVGEEVVLRWPATEGGSSKWRLSSFDSGMLSFTQGARLEQDKNGRLEWTVRFVARTPGETEVAVTRIALGPEGEGEVGERRRFQMSIQPR